MIVHRGNPAATGLVTLLRSSAFKIFRGRFGRVALLDTDAPLVGHAHPHCHILIKAGGADSAFRVHGERAPLADDTAALVNAWEHMPASTMPRRAPAP